MSSDSPKSGLFSSLSLGRAGRSKGSEPLAHPLLGASTSSVNLPDGESTTVIHAQRATRVPSSGSDSFSVPYKPRQRTAHGSTNSVSSVSSIVPSPTGPSTLATPPIVGTSPVTPTGISAAPITATSTSTTFALPPSAMDLPSAGESSGLAATIGGSSGSATSRLQLQSLKAAAQKMGLGNGSLGMGMIDAICEKSQAGKGKVDAEWAETLKLISAGKVVLLLPQATGPSTPITAQILRDHLAFVSPSVPTSSVAQDDASSSMSGRSGSSTSTAVVVTASGIVGTIKGSTLVLDSTLSPDSSVLPALRDPVTRTSTISSLRPTSLTPPFHFPSFTISTEMSTLSFPPINKGSSSSGEDKPKAPVGKLGRINPFANLFGASSPASPALGTSPSDKGESSSRASNGNLSPDRPSSPADSISRSAGVISPSKSRNLDSDAASIRSDLTVKDPEGYQVVAYTIHKQIKHSEISKSVAKAIKTTIREELHRLPEKVVDKVIRLVVAGACPTHTSSSDKSDPKALQLDYKDPTATGEKMQEFIEEIYDDLILHFRADSSHIFGDDFGSIRRKASWTRKNPPQDTSRLDSDSEEAKKERKERMRKERDALAEKEATEGTERVEAVICRFLYNRLFSPLESDDTRHDEALSSRIAALNMLDLSLDHLGLITRPDDVPPGEQGVIAEGLARVVDRIGEELQKLSLPTCLTPREKADILIKAHKAVVDGLTDLPPIDLRPEGEQYKPPSRPTSPDPAIGHDGSAIRTVLSTGSVAEALAASQTETPSSSQLRKPTSGSSSLLSTSPPSNDPLSSIEEVAEQTPHALRSTSSSDVPQLVLPDSNESKIEEAMSDSVLTLNAAEANQSPSPVPSEKKSPSKGGTSGADLILPIMIYAVVKSNPPQLASQLMYLRRYRSAICLTGEASYAIVNLTAVVEFLEHVELAQLGLGEDSNKVISVEDLSPIGLNYLDESNADAASIASASSRLRGRVFQVGELAGSAADSANKVITGVVDSSWTALRGLISAPAAGSTEENAETATPSERPNMRPRQASTFSLASVTASVATIAAAAASRSRSRANSRASAIMHQSKEEHTWKGNEEMVEVTLRPESLREKGAAYPSSDEAGSGTEDEVQPDDRSPGHRRRRSDARSIRSVSSALARQKSREVDSDAKERASISDRLASIGVLGRQEGALPSEQPQGKAGLRGGMSGVRNVSSSAHSRRTSLLGPVVRLDASPAGNTVSLPPPTLPTSPGEAIEPPLEQFMTCDLGDIKLSDIGVLLRDYRRLGAIVNSLQAKGA